MEKGKNIIIGVLAIGLMLMLLLKGCEPSKTDLVTKPAPVYHVDSIITKYIKVPNEVITYKTIYQPKEVLVYKTITKDSLISKETREYIDSVKQDDVITHYKAVVIGKLQSLDLKTEITNKKEIKTTEYITHTNTIVLPPKFQFWGGLGVKGSKTSFDVFPFVKIDLNRSSVLVSYDVFKKEYGLGIGYRLLKSKK